MKHQWDQPPPPNRATDAEVARDLDRYLAQQDRADDRAKAVERMAVDVLGDLDHYDALMERLAADDDACAAVFWVFHRAESPTELVRAAHTLNEALQKAAHAYADENLEKLLEGGL